MRAQTSGAGVHAPFVQKWSRVEPRYCVCPLAQSWKQFEISQPVLHIAAWLVMVGLVMSRGQ